MWKDRVDAVIRGDLKQARFLLVGRTPSSLQSVGLGPYNLVISAAKLKRCRREHPEVGLDVWHRLPYLLTSTQVAFPSSHRDGSIIVAIAEMDRAGSPIVVPILCDSQQNVILSVYGKSPQDRTGEQWIQGEIDIAIMDGLRVLDLRSADSEPKPESAEAISSSPGLIPVDGPAERKREILKLRPKVKEGDV